MFIGLTKKIQQQMSSHNFVVSIMGNLNQDFLKSLIRMTDSKLNTTDMSESIKKRIFHFVVECAQNICKPSEATQSHNDSLFVISKKDVHYSVFIGSVFSTAEAASVIRTIDQVNKLDAPELREKLRNEMSKEDSAQNTLLMSLVDISKRTKEKIQYEEFKISPDSSFVSFRITLSEENKIQEDHFDIYKMYRIMLEHELIIIYQGLFDQEIIKSMIAMTEKKLIQNNADEGLRRKLFNVMVEGLQNICKHQFVSDLSDYNPFLMIGGGEECYDMSTGNSIDNSKIATVEQKINTINALNKEELKEYYKEARLKSVISDVGGAGLGFIDMARKSGNKLQFLFDAINNERSYFILHTKISNN